MKLFADMSLLETRFGRSGRVPRVAVLALTLAGGYLLGMGRVQAQTPTQLATFNFNGSVPSGTTSLDKTGGVSTGTLTTNFAAPADVTNFTGTTVNAQTSSGTKDPAGQALALLGGSSNVENGRYITLESNSQGYSNLSLSFATQKTATGFNSNTLSYSTNGTAFTPYTGTSTNPYTPATAFATQSFDLSSITTLNNNADIFLRITFSGSTGTSQNNRIDNLTLTGNAVTPAPPGVVSAGIGSAVTGLGALLRRRKQSKSIKAAGATA